MWTQSLVLALISAVRLSNAQLGPDGTYTLVVTATSPRPAWQSLDAPPSLLPNSQWGNPRPSLAAPWIPNSPPLLPSSQQPGWPSSSLPGWPASTMPALPSPSTWGSPTGVSSAPRGTLSAVPAGPTARVEGGLIVGAVVNIPSAPRVHQFLGIPFAKSPPERWSPPDTRVRTWIGRHDATRLKPACIQQFNGKFCLKDSFVQMPGSDNMEAGPSREFTATVFNNPAPEESEVSSNRLHYSTLDAR
jgi:hypothetical protein